jgi:hypothetical protein
MISLRRFRASAGSVGMDVMVDVTEGIVQCEKEGGGFEFQLEG